MWKGRYNKRGKKKYENKGRCLKWYMNLLTYSLIKYFPLERSIMYFVSNNIKWVTYL
jgi:hypothetical protein